MQRSFSGAKLNYMHEANPCSAHVALQLQAVYAWSLFGSARLRGGSASRALAHVVRGARDGPPGLQRRWAARADPHGPLPRCGIAARTLRVHGAG